MKKLRLLLLLLPSFFILFIGCAIDNRSTVFEDESNEPFEENYGLNYGSLVVNVSADSESSDIEASVMNLHGPSGDELNSESLIDPLLRQE